MDLILSTAGGNFVEHASIFRYGEGIAKGGAPGARVAIYKVYWRNGRSEPLCYDADILTAFDQAIYDGVDMFSISLAGGQGNEGLSPGSVSNVVPWIITVGASTTDRKFISNAFLGNKKIYAGQSLSQLSLQKGKMYPLVSSVDVRGSGVSENFGLYCDLGSLDAKKVEGKIVACQRGGNVRKERKFAGQGVSYKTSSNHGKPAPIMESFSSLGPTILMSEILKADITAPGLNILTACSGETSPSGLPSYHRKTSFNIISDTSMDGIPSCCWYCSIIKGSIS